MRSTYALGTLLFSFLVLYIWSVNNTIASSLAVQTSEKQRIVAQGEIARMEGNMLRTAGGESLEDRARDMVLVVFGPARFLTREVTVARAGF